MAGRREVEEQDKFPKPKRGSVKETGRLMPLPMYDSLREERPEDLECKEKGKKVGWKLQPAKTPKRHDGRQLGMGINWARPTGAGGSYLAAN